MSISMWHELFKLVFIVLATTLVGILLLGKFAEITYKKAHRTHKAKRTVQVIYNIDSKNKTLQEVQAERRLMKGALVNG